jgi:uncharacterized surface protein with fasciclin (FAS1) repeats
MIKTRLAISLVALMGAAAGQEPPGRDILTTLRSEPSLTLFAAAAPLGSMAKTLADGSPLTVFAFSERALSLLSREERETLMANRSAMQHLTSRYIVAGLVRKDDAAGLAAARTLMGTRLRVDVRDEGVYVNGAIPQTDGIECSNGVIYFVDRFDPVFVRDALALAKSGLPTH